MATDVPSVVDSTIRTILSTVLAAIEPVIQGFFDAGAFILFTLAPATTFAFVFILFLYAFYNKYIAEGGGYA